MPGVPRLPLRPGPVAIALLSGAVAVALAGCSARSGAGRAATAAAQVRADQARAIAQQAGLGPAVQSFLAKAAGASLVTYTVVYDQGGGQSTTVMADPPNRRIDVVGAGGAGSIDRIIIKATTTYVCHLDGKRWSCVSGVDSSPPGPFAPDAISATISSLAQLSQSYDFTVTTRTLLGLRASCLTATQMASPTTDSGVAAEAVMCIAPSGVILRVEGSGSPLQATSYRNSVPSGAFDLPAHPTPTAPSTTALTLPTGP